MLDVVIAWLDEMRREDADAAAEHFHPNVTWHGLPADAICRSRAEVADMLRRTIARGRPETEALELIAGSRAVVLGVRSPDLREIGDVPLPGQLYNVFEIRDGVIVAARDFIHRADALQAAQAKAPTWT
jgi:limonene-1,2-epoxide hydrolase